LEELTALDTEVDPSSFYRMMPILFQSIHNEYMHIMGQDYGVIIKDDVPMSKGE
jgi:hypothetical protein